MKKLLSKTSVLKSTLLIILACLLCLTGCSNGEKEEKLSTAENSLGGYKLSYGEDWRVQYEGDSTVLYTKTVGGALPYAMMRIVSIEKSYESAKAYWEDGAEAFNTAFDSYTPDSREVFTAVDGSDGYFASMTVKRSDETGLEGQKEGESIEYRVIQLVFHKSSRIVCATYMAASKHSEEYEKLAETVKNSFEFTAAQEASKTPTTDKAAFKLSNVPDAWTLTDGEAYLKYQQGNTTVIAEGYSLSYSMSSERYWTELYEPKLKAGLTEYKLVSMEKEAHLGLLPAVDCVYTAKSATGTEYTFRTMLGVSASEVYMLTMTASAEDYEKCKADFAAMAEGFVLK